MSLDFLQRRFRHSAADQAIVWNDKGFTYSWLSEQVEKWERFIADNEIRDGSIVILEAEFSPTSIALFLALLERRCILVPLTSAVTTQREEFVETAQAEVIIRIDNNDETQVLRLRRSANHRIYGELRARHHPGLVLFSSGSTGKSKAAVHDVIPLLEKFKAPRPRLRSISFLLFDHIGGINTMLYVLSNGGCLITVSDRNPDNVLKSVQKHNVELLPVTPTFLNLVLVSEAYQRYDLSSLKTISYGTEPMPASTLKRFHELFPRIRMQQTYGLSEIGIMRSKSKASDSLWMKIGGEDFQTRIVEGILHIKAKSAMLGYLNAPTPFTEDGWFNTNDRVEVRDEYVRFLGRDSEIINVGGEKVYPAEVESVIQEVDNVAEVTVYGETHAIMGNIACARVSMLNQEEKKALISRIKQHCKKRLANYKVPVKIQLLQEKQHSQRFKKKRIMEG